jgi:hypothetical protein
VDRFELWPLCVTFKSGLNEKPRYYVMNILIRHTNDKNLEMIQPSVQELWHFVFLVLAPWWPNQESDWTEILPSGTYVQSCRSTAPAVTKRALLTDDGGHVIQLYRLANERALRSVMRPLWTPKEIVWYCAYAYGRIWGNMHRRASKLPLSPWKTQNKM